MIIETNPVVRFTREEKDAMRDCADIIERLLHGFKLTNTDLIISNDTGEVLEEETIVAAYWLLTTLSDDYTKNSWEMKLS